ncbi:uncharacterized conserved protein (UCP012943) [Wolffia australiana]
MGGGAAAKAAAGAGRAAWFDRAAAMVAGSRFPRPTAAAISAGGQIGEGSVTSSAVADHAPATEKKGKVELGEWELAGIADDRVIFGPVPTLDEAREATADLKNAFEIAYLTPAAGYNGSADCTVVSSVDTGCLENSNSGKELIGILPSYPKHVFQAFSMLQENPKAQEVVASLACDKNVWDAVMKNEMVVEFYKTHRIEASPEEPETPKTETTLNTPEPTIKTQNPEENNLNEEKIQNPGDARAPGLMGFVEFIRVKFEEMADKLSGFVKDIMGGSHPNSPAVSSLSGSAAAAEFSLGASFIALAIATILTILFKRG